jgi:predicted DNA-binding transcriptional regulator AlpA
MIEIPNDSLPADLSNHPHRLLNTAQAARFCGLGIHRWRELTATGRAPKPLRIGDRRLAWRLSELVGFIERRAALRDAT